MHILLRTWGAVHSGRWLHRVASPAFLLVLLTLISMAAGPGAAARSITSIGEIRSLPDTTLYYLYGGPGMAQGKFQQFPFWPDGAPTRQGWMGVDLTETTIPVPDHAGDFSKVLVNLEELDPCTSNPSPQMTFIDDGTPPSNDPRSSTGGTISVMWTYGVPGGFVVNYTNGVSLSGLPLANEVWSPPMAWDLPGPDDDDAGIAILEFDLWEHLPLETGMFWSWRVRSFSSNTQEWTTWQPNPDLPAIFGSPFARPGLDRANQARYRRIREILPVADAESLQIALGVIDLADALGLPGNDASPSPWFDNVMVAKLNAGGPVISIQERDLFHDAFPQDGSLTGSVRLDVARDLLTEGDLFKRGKDPGDSIYWTVQSGSDGVCVAKELTRKSSGQSRLVAVMKIQCTESHPGWPPPCADVLTADPRYHMEMLGDDLVQFEIEADHVGPLYGDCPDTTCPQIYAIDLPDLPEAPVFYPGSVLHYYIECLDCEGRITRLPDDLGGFLDFSPLSRWDSRFAVRALPSPEGRLPGVQPRILLWHDEGAELLEPPEDQPPPVTAETPYALWRLALAQLGLMEGFDYDVFTTRSPDALLGNGLGSAHAYGATPAQLWGYDILLYSSGRQTVGLISDGSEVPPNDSGDDVGLLTAWHEQPVPRYHIYFGDELVESLTESGPATRTYLHDVLGVRLVAPALGASVQLQQAPVAVPLSGGWTQVFAAYGACPMRRRFDLVGLSSTVTPDTTSRGPIYGFTNPAGTPYTPTVPAGILYDRLVDGIRKATVVFPFGLESVYATSEPAPSGGVSARAHLLQQTLAWMGFSGGGPPISTPEAPPDRLTVRPCYPNPFNPATTIEYVAPARGRLLVRIYDLRGRLVDRVYDGPVEAGAGSVLWRGTDEAGRQVASGVYLCEVEGFGFRHAQKLAILR